LIARPLGSVSVSAWPSNAAVIGGRGAGATKVGLPVRTAVCAARANRRQNSAVIGCAARHRCTMALTSASVRTSSSPAMRRHAPIDPPKPQASSALLPI